ncbi:hypothetical protein [Haloarcula sp. JP-L23]|uniref:hypothetical protein n=1 Tax=Haloarcula sp. JP-L23 TaxID=2716717 RepID=UPI00140F1883|nr:hypothetical protein G9465_18030 [Haloarcula sp. JP-L23]
MLVGIVDMFAPFLPQNGDVGQYHRAAVFVADHLRAGNVVTAVQLSEPIQVSAYSVPLGVLYALTVSASVVGIALNSGAWSITVLLWLKIARRLYPDIRIHVMGLLFVLYPAPVRFMSRTLRDALPLLCITILMLVFVRWLQDERDWWTVAGLGFVVPLVLLRVELVPPLCLGALAGWAYKHRTELTRWRVAALAVAILTSTPTFLWLEQNFGPGFLPTRLSGFEATRQNLVDGPNPYLVDLAYQSWFDIPLYAPVRLFYLLYSPFPWVLSSFELFLAATDALFILPLSLIAVYTLVRWRDRIRAEVVFALVYAFTMLLGYSLVVSTKGAASRRRLYAVPLLIVVAGFGLIQLLERQCDRSTNQNANQQYDAK